MKIILQTSRLLLRQFTEVDAPLIFDLNSNPEIIKYVHERIVETEEMANEILVNIILPQYKNNLGRWAVHTKNNNEFIGWCGLKFLAETGEIDLGYGFKKNAWGHGYATEAAKHTLAHGFNYLNLKTIVAKARVENLASINVLQKTGMQFLKEGVEDGFLIKVFIAVNPTQIN